MADKFQKLNDLEAGDFVHLDGNLLDHLKGTRKLLKSWSASNVLQDAGLYHAAYGTTGFNECLVSIKQRREITEIIGLEAEEIVYIYCACDREYFWPQIGIKEIPEFKNRFTGEEYPLNDYQLRTFCELTVANEIEISIDNPSFVKEYGKKLYSLFKNMEPYLSKQAYGFVQAVLGGKSPYNHMHGGGR